LGFTESIRLHREFKNQTREDAGARVEFQERTVGGIARVGS
jgi:hypothetical protein